MQAELLEPRRVRSPKGAYGWVDLRIVTKGHLQALNPAAALTYLFLCTVGNREGVSFWSRPRMARLLNLSQDCVDCAIQALCAADLIAATERIVQVLPIPDPATPALERMKDRPKTHPTLESLTPPQDTDAGNVTDDEIRVQEPIARAWIARFYGAREPSPTALRGLAKNLAIKARGKAV